MRTTPSIFDAVGIDVAKATLSVCLRSRKGTETALTLRNIKADITQKLLPHLQGFTGKIVLEATNHYHWLVTLLLTEAGYRVYVVNPLLAKQYTSNTIRKVKTDPADASSLARMAAISDTLPSVFQESREVLAQRKKLACIAKLTDQIQSLQSMIHQMKESHEILGIPLSKGEKAIKTTLKMLHRQKKTLEDEATHSPQPLLARHLDTIPGVTPFVAAACLALFRYQSTQTVKSWIGFAGLDVSSRESGTWKGRCRLTKRGNSFLRGRLFSAAWGAVMSNPDFKAYYSLLRLQKRSHVESLVIIARRIVRTMFKLVENNCAYDPQRFTLPPKSSLSPAGIPSFSC
jgi:transposase